MSKILIFGGDGFLGRYVAKEALERGHECSVVDAFKCEIEGVTAYQENITNFKAVKKLAIGYDAVYNFAAMADIDDCIDYPLDCVQVNALGNANILEACRLNNIPYFVYASSVYAGGSHGGFYATTKKFGEMLTEDYAKFYGLNYSILRYGTLFGLDAPATNSVQQYLRLALENNRIAYHGDGEESREYIHVKDAAHLTLDILNDLSKYGNKTISLVGDNIIKTKDLFDLINEILGGNIAIEYNVDNSIGRTKSHYKVSPYSYIRNNVHKLSKNINRDLGNSLLEILKEIDNAR